MRASTTGLCRATEGLAVALANPRADPALVERVEVTSVPLLVRFENGEPVDRLADGFVGTEAGLAFVER